MIVSLFLAKVIGLYVVLVVSALLINRKNVDLLFGIYKHPEAVYLSGVLDTVLGLLLVLGHNIWVMDFRVIITLIGWALLVRGVGRMLFPDKVSDVLEKFKKMKSMLMPLMILVFLVGAYLAYMGFTQ